MAITKRCQLLRQARREVSSAFRALTNAEAMYRREGDYYTGGAVERAHDRLARAGKSLGKAERKYRGK